MNEETNLQAPPQPPLVIPCVSRCPSSVVYLEDCVQGLKRYADNHFDLAIVDPPYGINISSAGGYYHVKGKGQANPHTKKDWDSGIPTAEYWHELFRVSKNQIVWGGNYMTEFLSPSRCWIFWDKMKFVDNYADGELAWTSFDRNTKKVGIQHHGFLTKDGKSIHPTQKPVMLYEWTKLTTNENAKPLEKYLPEIVYGEDRNYFAPCEIPIYEKLYLELGT